MSKFLTGLSVTAGKRKRLSAFIKSKKRIKQCMHFVVTKLRLGLEWDYFICHIAIVKEE